MMNRKIFEEIISKVTDVNKLAIYISGVSGGDIGSSSQSRYKNTTWSDGTREVVRIVEICDEYVVLNGGKIDKHGKSYLRDVYIPYSQIIRIEEFKGV